MAIARTASGAERLAPALHISARPSRAPRGQVPTAEEWRTADGAAAAYVWADGTRCRIDRPDVGTFRFDARGGRVVATRRPGIRPARVARLYRDAVMPMVVQARGLEVLHASAVRGPAGVVACCGVSGTGKSTIAYGLARRGHPQWADDALALDIGPAGAVAVRLAFAVRLRPAAAEHFGLGARARRLKPAIARAPAQRAPLAAVFLAEAVDGDAAGEPLVAPLAPSLAYPALLAHAFCFRFGDVPRKRLMLERYLALVARVPVFRLRLPRGLSHVGRALDAIEDVIGRAEAAHR